MAAGGQGLLHHALGAAFRLQTRTAALVDGERIERRREDGYMIERDRGRKERTRTFLRLKAGTLALAGGKSEKENKNELRETE